MLSIAVTIPQTVNFKRGKVWLTVWEFSVRDWLTTYFWASYEAAYYGREYVMDPAAPVTLA